MMEKEILEKMKSITTDQNQILSSIQKLDSKTGDVLLFYVKTDDQGIPLISIETINQTAKMAGELLTQRGAAGLFLMDKICLFSIEDAEKTIKILEKCISYIREATGYAPDIENGTFREPKIIDMKKAEDPSKRVL